MLISVEIWGLYHDDVKANILVRIFRVFSSILNSIFNTSWCA